MHCTEMALDELHLFVLYCIYIFVFIIVCVTIHSTYDLQCALSTQESEEMFALLGVITELSVARSRSGVRCTSRQQAPLDPCMPETDL